MRPRRLRGGIRGRVRHPRNSSFRNPLPQMRDGGWLLCSVFHIPQAGGLWPPPMGVPFFGRRVTRGASNERFPEIFDVVARAEKLASEAGRSEGENLSPVGTVALSSIPRASGVPSLAKNRSVN